MLVLCLRRKSVFELCNVHNSMATRSYDQLNAMDADMEQVLLLSYVTTKVVVKC